jgi:hypothetical protein
MMALGNFVLTVCFVVIWRPEGEDQHDIDCILTGSEKDAATR